MARCLDVQVETSYLNTANDVQLKSMARPGDIVKTLGIKPVGQIGAPTVFVHNAGRYLRPHLW